jgi:uncharacterized membrane protein YbhN (UPF0104 family)
MTGTAADPRQALLAAWIAQMVGTIVLALVVATFVKKAGAPFSGADEFKRYIFMGILAAAAPALYHLRAYKGRLVDDARASRERGGVPDPATRNALLKSLAVGGALCELPMAVGALHLFMGGEQRWFVGATCITLAIRLSYRPFIREPR